MQSTTNSTDTQTLIGASLSSEYLYQEQEAELLAVDNLEGYDEWSADLESDPWQGARQVEGILIKKACEHSACAHTRCERGLRLGGFDL